MNKLAMLVIFLLLACSNNKMMASCAIHENEVSSIVILGRAPSIIFAVSLGRYDFIDFCTSSSRQRARSAVIDNRDSINSIMLSINALEFEQALPSSCNFYYEIVSVLQGHHGEFGDAPVTVLAYIVHLIDMLDSQTTGIFDKIESNDVVTRANNMTVMVNGKYLVV